MLRAEVYAHAMRVSQNRIWEVRREKEVKYFPPIYVWTCGYIIIKYLTSAGALFMRQYSLMEAWRRSIETAGCEMRRLFRVSDRNFG